MTNMNDVVICEPVRTPVGRYGGVFKDKSAVEMGVAAVSGLLDRTGIPRDAVEDVIFAQCYPTMEAPALGRVVALDAGMARRDLAGVGCRAFRSTGAAVPDCRR